jgi:hypothetical protein
MYAELFFYFHPTRGMLHFLNCTGIVVTHICHLHGKPEWKSLGYHRSTQTTRLTERGISAPPRIESKLRCLFLESTRASGESKHGPTTH